VAKSDIFSDEDTRFIRTAMLKAIAHFYQRMAVDHLG
jgi:hypothetical protein